MLSRECATSQVQTGQCDVKRPPRSAPKPCPQSTCPGGAPAPYALEPAAPATSRSPHLQDVCGCCALPWSAPLFHLETTSSYAPSRYVLLHEAIRNPRRRSRGSSLGSQLTAPCFLPPASRWRLTGTSVSVSKTLSSSGWEAAPLMSVPVPGHTVRRGSSLLVTLGSSQGGAPHVARFPPGSAAPHTPSLQEVRSPAVLTLTFPRHSPRRSTNGCGSKGVTHCEYRDTQ